MISLQAEVRGALQVGKEQRPWTGAGLDRKMASVAGME